MLKNLSLKNFKGFQTLDNLEFKPITILCGTNSSGKSSILKSILLLKQTFESQNLESLLQLNGKYLKLGSIKDIIYNHDEENEIEFTFSFNFEDLFKRLEGSSIKSIVRDFFSISIAKNPENKVLFSVCLKKNENSLVLNRLILKSEQVLLKLEHRLGRKYTLNCEKLFYLSMKKDENRFTTENLAVEVVFDKSIVPSIIIPIEKDEQTSKFSERRSVDLMCHYSGVLFKFFFEQISYIGPLRKEPARRYIYEEEISSIGNRGENAAFIYTKEKNKKVDSCFYNENKNKFEFGSYKLGTAVNHWLKMMNIIDFNNNQRNEIIRLNMKSDSGVKVDISDVGFGVSQIFPIIVEGLRMKKGQTLLLEQPEIHLHPKLQMQLTDFFIAMAKCNKNTIIETHSEHIINRLVRRSLEDDDIAKLINIYFIENTEPKLIQIDKNKGIINWPKNFFDQAANEEREILRLAIENRRK